jgi:hypothetical protein
MDDQQQNGGGNGDHVYGQAAPATQTQPQLIPMGEGWAPGVGAAPVPSKSRRVRWGIALGFVAIVAIVGTAGAYVLSGTAGAGQSLTAAYAPKNTISFTVLRTDLPGDQHQKLADFLSHFPGFADRALFDSAMDTELNHIVSSISPDLTYTSAFKPWMQGEISIAATGLGSLGSGSLIGSMSGLGMGAMMGGLGATGLTIGSGTAAGAQIPDAVVMVALKDRTAAETFVSSEVAKVGQTFTSSSYAGATLYTTGSGNSAASYAFIDNVLLLGTPDGVRASLDAKSKGSLAADDNYKAAMKSLSGDSVATFYIAESALIKSELASIPTSTLPQDDLNYLLGNIPAWTAGQVRAESDHLLVETTMPRPGISPAPGNHVSTLAPLVPSSTVAIVETHSLGEIATSALDSLTSQAAPLDLRNQLNAVKTAIAGFGGLDWLGDGAVVVTKDGSTYDGGVVVQTTDAKTASDKLDLVRTLVTATGGSGISSTDDTYKGVTITTLRTSGGTALEPGIPDTTGMMLNASISFAAKDGLIIAGADEAFVKSVIDTSSSNSLASSDTYKAALAAAGNSNAGSAYVDIPTIVAGVVAALPASDAASFNTDVKPYLDHVGGAAFANIDGSTITVRLIVMAK